MSYLSQTFRFHKDSECTFEIPCSKMNSLQVFCRIYNEEGSLIYEDANKLEKVLRERARQLGADPTKPKLKKYDL